MLDVFAYPVSALMQLWHDLLSLLVPAGASPAWVGSIVLLVLTVRLLLLPLAWAQARTSRRMTALRPRLAALKAEYGDDRVGYVTAARQLQRDEGAGGAGLLPLVVQVPVFLGLYHLLAGFSAVGGTGGNGVFTAAQVASFAHATLAGVPLAAAVRSAPAALSQLQAGLVTGEVVAVVLPLLLVAAAAALATGLVAARRQPAAPADDPLSTSLAVTGRVLFWFAPVSILVGGLLFPVPLALVLYWAVNGAWTTVQTITLNRRLDRLVPTGPPDPDPPALTPGRG